jgi:hypothetical protein
MTRKKTKKVNLKEVMKEAEPIKIDEAKAWKLTALQLASDNDGLQYQVAREKETAARMEIMLAEERLKNVMFAVKAVYKTWQISQDEYNKCKGEIEVELGLSGTEWAVNLETFEISGGNK